MRTVLLLAVVACSSPSEAPAPKVTPANPTAAARTPSTAPIQQLVVGGTHSCALHEDGLVSCWGLNTSRQLGIENQERSLVPVAMQGLSGVVELSAEDDMTCARKSDGTAHCWGGLGEASTTATPAQLLDHVAHVAGRCFLMTNGTVQCLTMRAQLVAVDGVDDGVELAAWSVNGCVLRKGGQVKCWLGDKVADVPSVKDARQITVNQTGGCAITNAGLRCWFQSSSSIVDTDIYRYPDARGVQGGGNTMCVRLENDIECWQGYDGEKKKLGVMPSAPLAIGGHSCVGRGGRDVACWGNGLDGQLGNGWFRRRPTPTKVPGLEHVVEIAGANRGAATCARTTDGDVYCWGEFLTGAEATPKKIPVTHVSSIVASETIRVIDDQHRVWARDYRNYYDKDERPTITESNVASASDQCFITTTGKLKCWRGYAQPDPKNANYALVPKIDDAVEVATFSDQGYVCVRRKAGKLQCFHKGTDATTDIDITDATALAVSEFAQCAIRADRSLWCWGSMATEIFARRPDPIDIPPTQIPIGEVTAVSLVRDNICVVRIDGHVACWGANSEGQLGDGTFMPRSQGADVIGITDAIDVSVGASFACAVHRTGDVSCWGATDRGQVGSFVMNEVAAPVLVAWP